MTLTFNQPGSGRPVRGLSDSAVEPLRDKLKEWDARMQRRVIGSNWFNVPDNQLFCLYTLEKPGVNPHWHGLVHFWMADDDERRRQGEKFDRWANELWQDLVPAGDVDVKTVSYEAGAIDYVGKSLLDQLSYANWVPPDSFRTA
ncbi:hypothetical protein PRN20_09510 [Devosia sp. ZB163]|uniref:hypothetical protein n=1 Tax=Devosia sp. ZB163 TaxID=3025938 RepID=UPI00235E2FB0|nr:hypothetical protein [Devosia sp. ZB163]MDC9823972.1 hypothetical protein [Devosia sp. ZB163]